MRDAAYWQRKYERAEAGRLQALDQLQTATRRVINTAADEMQQQIDALEQMILKRAALVKIETDARVLRFTFVRRGALYRIETYNAVSNSSVAEWRKTLLED